MKTRRVRQLLRKIDSTIGDNCACVIRKSVKSNISSREKIRKDGPLVNVEYKMVDSRLEPKPEVQITTLRKGTVCSATITAENAARMDLSYKDWIAIVENLDLKNNSEWRLGTIQNPFALEYHLNFKSLPVPTGTEMNKIMRLESEKDLILKLDGNDYRFVMGNKQLEMYNSNALDNAVLAAIDAKCEKQFSKSNRLGKIIALSAIPVDIAFIFNDFFLRPQHHMDSMDRSIIVFVATICTYSLYSIIDIIGSEKATRINKIIREQKEN